jgi:predicted nucleic acid-binding Zn ribbon protein
LTGEKEHEMPKKGMTLYSYSCAVCEATFTRAVEAEAEAAAAECELKKSDFVHNFKIGDAVIFHSGFLDGRGDGEEMTGKVISLIFEERSHAPMYEIKADDTRFNREILESRRGHPPLSDEEYMFKILGQFVYQRNRRIEGIVKA